MPINKHSQQVKYTALRIYERNKYKNKCTSSPSKVWSFNQLKGTKKIDILTFSGWSSRRLEILLFRMFFYNSVVFWKISIFKDVNNPALHMHPIKKKKKTYKNQT